MLYVGFLGRNLIQSADFKKNTPDTQILYACQKCRFEIQKYRIMLRLPAETSRGFVPYIVSVSVVYAFCLTEFTKQYGKILVLIWIWFNCIAIDGKWQHMFYSSYSINCICAKYTFRWDRQKKKIKRPNKQRNNFFSLSFTVDNTSTLTNVSFHFWVVIIDISYFL